LKEFMGTFFACIVICGIAAVFLLGLFPENIWAFIIFFAFILAVFITVFMKQESRIENLEKKVEELLNNKHD